MNQRGISIKTELKRKKKAKSELERDRHIKREEAKGKTKRYNSLHPYHLPEGYYINKRGKPVKRRPKRNEQQKKYKNKWARDDYTKRLEAESKERVEKLYFVGLTYRYKNFG